MRARYLTAAALVLVPVALVVCLFGFAAHMEEKGRVLGDGSMQVDEGWMLAWDTAMFWRAWGWVIGPAVILLGLGLAVAVVRSGSAGRQ
jgi:hypothetical protein